MTDLTHESFPAFVSTHSFAVVHFWAAWNGYDLELRQWLEHGVPMDLLNQIAFGRLDIDPPEHWEICRQHKVLNVPVLAFYRDGAVVETFTGKRDKHFLIEHMRQLVA